MSGSAEATASSPSANASIGEVGLHARLRAHPLDDPADPGRQLARVQAARGPGDVAHEPAGELDLVQDPQHGEHRPEVGGHRLLEREQLVHAVLDLEHAVLDLPVGVVDLVDDGEVGVEQRLGRGADLLAALHRELHDLGPDLLQLFVERPPGLDHDVLRNSCLFGASLPRGPAATGTGDRPAPLFTCWFTNRPSVPYGPASRRPYHGHVAERLASLRPSRDAGPTPVARGRSNVSSAEQGEAMAMPTVSVRPNDVRSDDGGEAGGPTPRPRRGRLRAPRRQRQLLRHRRGRGRDPRRAPPRRSPR